MDIHKRGDETKIEERGKVFIIRQILNIIFIIGAVAGAVLYLSLIHI